MNHGVVEVFAYQETLLLMAVFGVAILTMIWIGFRRWLQHKERVGQLIAEQTAERAAQYGASMERVDARLKALEQEASESAQPVAQIDAPATNLGPGPISKRDKAQPGP